MGDVSFSTKFPIPEACEPPRCSHLVGFFCRAEQLRFHKRGRNILKDSKIEEITPIFQIEDANSASHPPVVQIEDIHVATVVFQGVSRDS